MRRTRKILVVVLINIVLTVLLFLTVEGFSSVVVVVRQTFFSNLLEERKHTQYDQEIGWVNIPGLYLENMYGPGKSFRTNSMAFRSNHELAPVPPAGKVRLVCSGDSFTMGYGVDTDAGWCQLLESIDSRIEPVNLGQGGYGVDQAYLWYKRNSPRLQHGIHVFAFITDDFLRMESDNFSGYGRPVMKVENGVLVQKNRPVPKLSYSIPRLPAIRAGVSNLSVVKLLHMFRGNTPPSPGKTEATERHKTQLDEQTREVALKIFEDLQKTNESKNSALVLVYLPQRSDYPLGQDIGPWRQFFHEVTTDHRIPAVDLVDEIGKLSPQDAQGFFSKNGHFSEKGNRLAAQLLYKQLLAFPEIETQLRKAYK